MTPEQIKQWAQESGFVNSKIFGPLVAGRPVGDLLERFAALVAAHEREACALVCASEEARALYNFDNDLGINRNFWNGGSEIAASCAASITARGKP